MTLLGYDTWVDLIILDMMDFDVNLGMDWLSLYHDIFDCHAKIVTLVMSGAPRIEWKGTHGSYPRGMIFFLKAQRMVEKGCLSYLAYVCNTSVDAPSLESVPVVCEFLDVFPTDLPGVLPKRDIDLCIDLEPGTRLIFIIPYRIALAELKALKE